MNWLERHSWWLLAATAAIYTLFGASDIPAGTPDNAMAVTGLSAGAIASSSPQAYALLEEHVRTGGVHLVAIGLFALAVLIFGFRQGERWAWWTMWLLPGLSISLAAIAYMTTAPGQNPPAPVYSGAIFALVDASVLAVSARRFFRRTNEVPAPVGISA